MEKYGEKEQHLNKNVYFWDHDSAKTFRDKCQHHSKTTIIVYNKERQLIQNTVCNNISKIIESENFNKDITLNVVQSKN